MTGSFKDAFDAYTSGGPFEGFAPADFEAYQTKKWSSNAYTLARRQAKDKLLALAHAVSRELKAELGARELHGSDEAPTVANGKKVDAQWAFFVRDGAARHRLKPMLGATNLSSGHLFDIALHQQHACLALRLEERGLAIGFVVMPTATVDRDNIAQKLESADACRGLVELARALPAGTFFCCGEQKLAAGAVDAAGLGAWRGLVARPEHRFAIELLVPKADVSLSSETFVAQAAEHLRRFAPVADFLAWSETNDFAGVGAALEKVQEEKTKAAAERFKKGDRVTILSGFFAGQGGFVVELDPGTGKVKLAVGPASLTVDVKDLKPA